MFHKKSLFQRVIYKLGPGVSILILLASMSVLAYVMYQKYIFRKIAQSERLLFSKYIYEYALELYDATDDAISYTIDSFKFNDKMFDYNDASKAWDTDTEIFMTAILQVQALAVASTIETSRFYKDKKVWEIVHHFIETVQLKIPTVAPHRSVPWGHNWYQYSITYPLFLVICAFTYEQIFNKPSKKLMKFLATYIHNYFENPDSTSGVMSMGWLRDGPNAVMMAVPYIGGHLLMKNLQRSNNIMRYVKNFVKFNYVTSGEGLYADGGFIFHSNLRAYGYLYSSYNDISIVAKYFKFDSPYRIQKIFRIFEHPNLSVHYSPWFTRSRGCSTTKKKTRYGTIGFFCVDSINAVIAKTDNWMLAFNGQSPKICYYESDQANNMLAQIWVTSRVFLDKDSDAEWLQDLIPFYPGVISYDNQLVRMPSTTTTTQTFLPGSQSHTIMCSWDSAIGIRNVYSIPYNTYMLQVEELVLITEMGHHSYYRIRPNQTLHSNNPLTISMNLGKYNQISRLMGLGDFKYSFEKNSTFVYSDIEPYLKHLQHPITHKAMSCLQLKPRMSGIGEMTFGYSTIYGNVNELTDRPTINSIKTANNILEYDDMDGYLYLYNINDRTDCAISKKYPETYVNDISIPIATIHRKFGQQFQSTRVSKIHTDYRQFTKDRYQMILIDITAKIKAINF